MQLHHHPPKMNPAETMCDKIQGNLTLLQSDVKQQLVLKEVIS